MNKIEKIKQYNDNYMEQTQKSKDSEFNLQRQ
jgi:hypothetical protein